MADTCEKCGEDYTCRRCACMRGDPDPSPQPGVSDGCGVAVNRKQGAHPEYEYHEPMHSCEQFKCETGKWFPEAEAAALVAVGEAVLSMPELDDETMARRGVLLQEWIDRVIAAGELLDAARSPA